MLESRLGSNDRDDWRIPWDLVENVLCSSRNNLSVRIIKLRIRAKFEDCEAMKDVLVESIYLYDNIVMHYEDKTRKMKMAAELNGLAQICGGPEILFANTPNSIHFADKVIVAKKQEALAPFSKEKFLNGPNEDLMLEGGLESIKKKSKIEMVQEIGIPSSERSLKKVQREVEKE
jgi:hypothetical protein